MGPRSPANTSQIRPLSIWGLKCFLQASLMFAMVISSCSKGTCSWDPILVYFLLFAWYICIHSLHYYFFRHCAFLSCFLAVSLGSLNSSISPPCSTPTCWRVTLSTVQKQTNVKRAHGFIGRVIDLEAWGGFGSGSAGTREQFTFNFTSNESRSSHGRALPLALFFILFSECTQF